jgi:RNA polymerase-binding transcription factor DksA
MISRPRAVNCSGPVEEPAPSGILVRVTRDYLDAQLAAAGRRAADLEAELAELQASTDEGADDEHDPEGATIGYERARVTGLLGRAQAEVAALRAAADRVGGGAYGRCVECGGTIPDKRLKALPATERCLACASSQRAARSAHSTSTLFRRRGHRDR